LRRFIGGAESQEVEFKSEFPAQADKLAREIAAFATSNDGVILIGMTNDGALLGLDADTPAKRDQLEQRVSGISRAVDPPVLVRTGWALEQGRVVLVVFVSKGPEPVYFAQERPYLRHGSSARPAKAAEVTRLVKEFLQQPPDPTPSFLGSVTGTLASILRFGEEHPSHLCSGADHEDWMWHANFAQRVLRESAANTLAHKLGVDAALLETARALDRVLEFVPLFAERIPDFGQATQHAALMAQRLFNHLAPEGSLAPSLESGARELLIQKDRKLNDLWTRVAEEPLGPLLEEALKLTAADGVQLWEIYFYPLSFLSAPRRHEVRQVAAQLVALRRLPLYMDGGESQRRVVSAAHAALARLHAIAEELSTP
jgi:hypothetical protein